MTNYFKTIAGDNEFTGMNLILGTFSLHLLEGDALVVNHILTALNEYSHSP